MTPRSILISAALALAALAVFLVVLWSPERQVRLHQKHLLAAVSKKDWPRFASFIAEDYSDRWGHDKTFVRAAAREVFAQFFVLEITMQNPAVSAGGGNGEVSARLVAKGTGSPVAQMVIEKLQELREPFTFRWRQRSWKPRDWALARVDQPALEIPDEL